MNRVGVGLVAAILATVVAARLAFIATATPADKPVNQPWMQGTMQFVSWNHEKWAAWIHDNAFEQIPEDTATWNRHTNVSLPFLDWDGEPWQAKVEGDEFLLVPRGDWGGDIQRAHAIRYRDWDGENRLRTVAQLRR